MSRTTGKTLPDCYVEFASPELLRAALDAKSSSGRHLLLKKPVKTELSSQKELFGALFPNFRVQGEAAVSIEVGTIFLIREEIFTLLTSCRAIRSRSPAKIRFIDRPYDNIISILSKVPVPLPSK